MRAEAQLFELFQELRHAITEAEVLRTTVLPEMEAALEATRYAYERGRYSYLEWVDAQRELVDVQRALIDAVGERPFVSYRDRTPDRRTAVGANRGLAMNKLHLLILALAARGRLRRGDRLPAADEHADEHAAEAERGPNGGRLLADGDFTLELAIFEAGVPPEFHAWATAGGRPLAPARRRA